MWSDDGAASQNCPLPFQLASWWHSLLCSSASLVAWNNSVPFFWGSWARFHQFEDVINVSARTCLFLALLLVSVSIQRIPLEAVPGEARCSDAGGSRRGQGEHGARSWFGSTMPCTQRRFLHATAVMGACSEQTLGSAGWSGSQLVLAAAFCCLAFSLSLTGLFECVKRG